jgi:PadR family transcriptional regulator, regulatory protein PadR
MTPQLLKVLLALTREPGLELYGQEISRVTGLPSGTVHPILLRLLLAGWVTDRWAEVPGRPKQRYWRATELGYEKVGPFCATDGGEPPT